MTALILFDLFSSDWAAGPLRWFGAVVALIALFLWTASSAAQWEDFSGRSKRITVSICTLLGGLAYGLSEAASKGVEPGPRVYVIVVTLMGLVGVLGYKFNEKP